MANEGSKAHTHFQNLAGRFDIQTSNPAEPVAGDFYYDNSLNRLCIFNGSAWKCASFTTTTSTSTSTTSTSTSTSTTSTSTTTTTTTSTSTSTTTSTTTTF